MKKILIIIALLCSLSSWATNYYVKTGGNNSNTGLSDAQAWADISKVNTVWAALTFAPGDSILFKRGNTFTGTITVSESGTSGNPIIVGAYGTGANPIITGLTTLSSWTAEANGIYSASLTGETQTNMVLIDGIQYGVGRYPNSGWLSFEYHSTTTSISDKQLSGTPSWIGSEIVIRKNDYVLDRNTVTNHVDSVLTYTTLGSVTTPINGNGYWFQNSLQTLDVTNEWYHNISTNKLYVYGNPSAKVVRAVTLDYLFKNVTYDYITIRDLTFIGANKQAIYYYTSANYGNILNCNVYYSGDEGIYMESLSGVIDGCTINHVNGNGIHTASTFMTVTNNTIKNCGNIIGAAKAGNYTDGIVAYGADNLYQYNYIDSVGYNGIFMTVCNRAVVRNNFVNHFCTILTDGGGIYTANGTYTGRVIDGNIVLNGIGGYVGLVGTNAMAEGIYIDEPAANIQVTNNTCAFNQYSGIKLHNANNIYLRNNTLFGNKVTQLRLQESNGSTPLRLNTIFSNKFICKEATEYALKHFSITDDVTLLGTLDSNYYARPIDDDYVISSTIPQTDKTLTQWQSVNSQDLHSNKSPFAVASTNYILFDYSITGKTVTGLTGYKSLSGATVASYTLAPYESIILLTQGIPAGTLIRSYGKIVKY